MPDFIPPPDYGGIKVVHSFAELLSTPWTGNLNALCWPRTLPGNFAEIADKLATGPGITTIADDRLRALTLSPAGQIARDLLLQDQELLRSHGLDPVLDCINGYVEDEEDGPYPTNVRSWHVDSATVAADTWLCTYHGLSSEGLRNDQAIRRMDIPATRAELLDLYGGYDDDEFLEFLNDCYFDLHYLPTPNATPYTFGIGNLWRVAIQCPNSPTPPCIHRAPIDTSPRLLLIS